MTSPSTLGWREWLALPELGIAAVKAKIDSGARTSALHAEELVVSGDRVRFALRAWRDAPARWCELPLLERRWISDSGGHRDHRPVVRTRVTLAGRSWPIELSLTTRDGLRFPMLLGRTALAGRFVVDPAGSYLQGRRRRALPA